MIKRISELDSFDPPTRPKPAPSIPDHELLRCIGQGSYGEVWLARSIVGTFRAIKIVYRDTFEEDRPYKREFSGIQKFEPISRSNDGLMHILQIGRNDQAGYFYYVMELADDGSANGRARISKSGCPIPHAALSSPIDPLTYLPKTLGLEKLHCDKLTAQECLRIGLALTLALDHLHRNGLIHRDIKPSNIVFVKGMPKLADIGLVAELSEARSYVGTEGFIPPEGPNSAQADIYSLGKVLYEAAMGKDRQDFPEPCSDLAENPDRKLLIELNTIILKACEPDANRRYKTVRQMHDELKLLQNGKSVREKRARERRLTTMAWMATAVFLVTLAALGVNRILDWRVRALQGESILLKPALIGKIQPRDASAPHESVDLSRYYTAPLIESWYPGPRENTLESMPKGLQSFAGVKFDVRGLVQLSGQEINSYGAEAYPGHLRGIPIDRWVKRLHFLEGALSEVMDGKQIGAYHIEYRSGRTADIPIVYGRDLRALWQPADGSGIVSNSIVAWTGQNPATRERKMVLRVYKQSWENPQPNDEIIDLSFRSAMGNSAPFLVALSCDEHEPPPDQKQLPLDLVKALQSAAPAFQQIQTDPAASGELRSYTLKGGAVKIGNEYFDGLRFTVPKTGSSDLVWALTRSTNFHGHGWHILPLKGSMKVGFEDWYHGIGDHEGKQTPGLMMQSLAAKKLQPGRDYFIWFSFGDNQPAEIHALLRFIPPGEINPNHADTLARALGLDRPDAAEHIQFHRHYCLGASR